MAVRSVRGLEMAYDEAGSGVPVVLLHGFPFNRTLWREQLETLAATHRVVAPDLRGFGETSLSREDAATMEEMARDVAALMDELRIERAILGGLSMGGYVALAFFRLFSRRVRALVLADTRPQADSEEGRRDREEMARRALDGGMGAIAEAMMPKLLAPATHMKNPQAVARVREMILSTKPEAAAAALRGMAARQDQTNSLQNILQPTLIVVGSEDQLTPPADSETMRREIRGSRLEVIDGAGHVSNVERPREFNAALTKFLKDMQP
ncbi:MAG TPA: alpha/beta fold hydrolase [Pyrinomonadaceae bacterium]